MGRPDDNGRRQVTDFTISIQLSILGRIQKAAVFVVILVSVSADFKTEFRCLSLFLLESLPLDLEIAYLLFHSIDHTATQPWTSNLLASLSYRKLHSTS